MTDSTEKIVNKHIQVRPKQWELIEQAAEQNNLTTNQLVIELTIESLKRRRMFSHGAEIRVAWLSCSPRRPLPKSDYSR